MDATTVREQVSCPEAYEMLTGDPAPASRKVHCWLREENTPSMHLYDDHYYCFSCQANGSVIDMVMSYTGWSFGRALRVLSGQVDDLALEPRVVRKPKPEAINHQPEFHAKVVGVTPAHERLVEERWPYLRLPDVVAHGVRPSEHGLMIPHYSYGQVTGVKTIAFDGKKSAFTGSRFVDFYRGRGASSMIVRPGEHWKAVIVEGESDLWCMAKYVAGKPVDVYALPSGAGTVRKEWFENGAFAGYHTVYIATDNDRAGDEARAKLWHHLYANGKDLRPPYKDVADSLARGWEPAL